MALYLKYRPQILDDLIGQDHVLKLLQTAHSFGKLSHAYLLCGPRGTGKTSLARILAKMVNCEFLGDSDVSKSVDVITSTKSSITKSVSIPCNKCHTCMSITDGSNMDLIEIDAASNRGIDDIRALRENVKLAPSASIKKVYIIDEVHMLTTEAFSGLLKTLEEPPEHCLFILATTEVQKIPQTILSRVQRLDFKLASVEDITKVLKKVVEGEGIKIEDRALKLLAKLSEGSFRDGVKMLDQVSTLVSITGKDIENLLRSGSFDQTLIILENFAKKDSSTALKNILQQIEGGVQIKELIVNLLETVRVLILIKSGLEEMAKEEIGGDNFENLKILSDNFSTKDLITISDRLQRAYEAQKASPLPSLPLEIAVVEICEESQKFEEKTIEFIPGSGSKVGMDKSAVKHQSIDTDVSDLSKIKEKWSFVLETIRPYNFSLEALLRSVKIAKCSGGLVTLEVPYSFHQRILESQKSRDLLESVFSEVLGKVVKVSTVLGTRPQRVEDIANIEVAAEDEIITMASEIFNGKLVD